MSKWKEYKLNEIAEIFDHKRIPLSTMERQKRKGIYPYYGASGIIDYIDDFIFDGEYVLISEDGENLRTRQSPIAFIAKGKFWVNNHAHVIKGKNNYLNKLIVYYFKNLNLNPFLTGAVQPKLNKTTLLSIPIYLPEDMSEQKAIASVLSSFDDKIDLLHRQNQTLEQMAQTLFRKWFIEEAKEDWEEGFLPDEFDFLMGHSPKGSSFNEYGFGIPMYQGNADFGFRFPKKRIFTTEPKRFAEKFDTLISVRAPVGEQNMALEKCCIGRGLARFRYKLNPNFYSYTYYKLKYLINKIKLFNDEGTVFGSISKGDFQKLEIMIPPIDIIEKFQQQVKPIDDKIIQNSLQIQTLKKLRDTLLPKLMSGEIRIKNAE
ncbi:restriction endonuclease subunit S [Nitratiruptor sp. SB155-2]|uniref:restriction endonuclease subunit S n=1 Tax=Nitratiruptor sp. (strain SB155-2) TaxID=387092 RepID=UPI0001586FEA|nr:restriction endonuclease subunit S [Nitratiruptor sp. SB155-2]BAF70810.1 type I restriction-modification system, S subunit [Nitratiruptor sp. SB155-2]